MPYQLSLVERPGYLHARATGTHNAENALRFLIEAAAARAASNARALLLEFAFAGPSLNGGAIHEIVSQGATGGAKCGRIAYVDSSTERDLEHMRFAETVARNRGVDVRLFRRIEDAIGWLVTYTS